MAKGIVAGYKREMSVTVFQMAHSPYCIPITQALRACDVAVETYEVPNWDRGEIIRMTHGAYYAVPLLVHGEAVIYETGSDTQDVARYVDHTFAAGKLFPARLEGVQAITIEFLEDQVEAHTFRLVDPYYIDTIEDVVNRTMVIRHKERKFGRGCVEDWRARAGEIRAQADRLLARFEETLRHSRFLFGEAPVYSDFLLFGILGNLTWNGWNSLQADSQRSLIRWKKLMHDYRFPKISEVRGNAERHVQVSPQSAPAVPVPRIFTRHPAENPEE